MDVSPTPAAAKRDGAVAMRIAVLQHTHTAKPAYIFRRAREQIVQWRAGHPLVKSIAMDHHVSLWADLAEQCQSTLKAIADELGSYENLTCIKSDTISATLPALSYASVARMRRAGPHTRYLSATNKSFQWSWNSGDAAVLFWFSNCTATLPRYEFFWTMEWDTVWTGSLPRMLAAFHGEPFSANSTIAGRAQGLRVAYDLLGHELEGAHANYPHKNKVNHSFIEYKDAMYSSTQLMRYSRRLLRRVVEDLEDENNFAFCEMRVPSTCARMERERREAQNASNTTVFERAQILELSGCTWSSLQNAQPPGAQFFGAQGRRVNMDGFSSVVAIGFETVPHHALANDSHPSRFYHRFKWDYHHGYLNTNSTTRGELHMR